MASGSSGSLQSLSMTVPTSHSMPTVPPTSIPHDWLSEKLDFRSFEEVLHYDLDNAQLVDADIEELVQKALERGQADWNTFVSDMIPTDELWFFTSSPDEWASLAGRSGYAIVREGQIVKAQITAKS